MVAPIDARLPDGPPFAIRARVVSPLEDGGTLDLPDAVVWVGPDGRLTAIEAVGGLGVPSASHDDVIDLRGLVVLPGLVDLHVHLPQLPSAGLGAGQDLLSWLERWVFPLEREFDEVMAARVVPAALRTFAAAGTTTIVAYSAVYAGSTDAAFRAAEAHGIRAVIGQVLMDRERYERRVPDDRVLEVSIRESTDLIARWHDRDDGRLRYAVTPRFAVACSAALLRESAALSAATGTYWQTHVSEDRRELATVAARFPEARDYLDVYDRAGGLSERAILAHAVHLSPREVDRVVETGATVAHCPSSNLFLASGSMPLARYLEAGVRVGLGSDVAGGPHPSLFDVMRIGSITQNALCAAGLENRVSLDPLGWLRLATLDGARCLGLGDTIGSLEPGKEADLILVDPRRTAPLPRAGARAGSEEAERGGRGVGGDAASAAAAGAADGPADGLADPRDLLSRLIHRAHPDMVRAAWVRGRRLAGPGGWEPSPDDDGPPGDAVPSGDAAAGGPVAQGAVALDTDADPPPSSER